VQYDTDVTTWSPQGRLFQVEYAMEAVKQGSAAVGLTVRRMGRIRRGGFGVVSERVDQWMGVGWLVHAGAAHKAAARGASTQNAHTPQRTQHNHVQSKTHAVLATLKRAQNELSSYQRKIFKIDDHMGIAISGLTADGRVLCRYMRNECLNHR